MRGPVTTNPVILLVRMVEVPLYRHTPAQHQRDKPEPR